MITIKSTRIPCNKVRGWSNTLFHFFWQFQTPPYSNTWLTPSLPPSILFFIIFCRVFFCQFSLCFFVVSFFCPWIFVAVLVVVIFFYFFPLKCFQFLNIPFFKLFSLFSIIFSLFYLVLVQCSTPNPYLFYLQPRTPSSMRDKLFEWPLSFKGTSWQAFNKTLHYVKQNIGIYNNSNMCH